MKNATHYDILGVSRTADLKEIKKAYRKMALQWHPDRNDGSDKSVKMFTQISLAYEVLSDPSKRKGYDLGFDANRGTFDPSTIDPSLLDPEEFIKTFATLFGDYLDARVPGGFRSRVNKAGARATANAKKKKSKKKSKKKDKKEPREKGECQVCYGDRRIELRQGTFTTYVSCRACSAMRTG